MITQIGIALVILSFINFSLTAYVIGKLDRIIDQLKGDYHEEDY